jgi:molecular chaperone HtpG
MADRVDEWFVSHCHEFEGKSFKSIAKGELEGLNETEEEKKASEEKRKQAEKDFEPLVKRVEAALSEKVQSVKLSERLTDSPCCLVAGEHDLSMNLKRMLQDAGQALPDSKPILEINADHQFIEHMMKEQSEDVFKTWCQVLLDQAMLAEGAKIENPTRFVKSFNHLITTLM